MDRSRGSSSSYRGSDKYTSSYSSRNFESSRPSQGFSSSSSSYRGPRDYESYSSDHGNKRRYDDSNDHRKSYDHHGGREGSPRKYYRSDSGQNYEARSNHRSHHEPSNSSSNRGRYGFSNGSSSRHDSDSYHSQRRLDDSRRYHQSSSSTSYRGSGGYVSSRGRGRGRPTSYTHPHSSRRYSRERDHKSDREHSRSPPRFTGDEESIHASDGETKMSQEEPKQLETYKEDASSENNAVELTEGDRSTRGDTERAGPSDDRYRERSADPTSKDDDKETKSDVKTERSTRHSESERSPRKPISLKDPPEHFIRLQCPHCNQRSVTFREYILHLGSKRHAEALEKVSLQHRMSLAKLRTRQRKEQSQIEAQSAKPQHNSRMNFCAICKLYHSESRPNHETTELHKIIKNFLMPFCPICRVHFKSRMLYEKHVATLTHIKNKVNMEKTYERRREEERKQDRNGHEKDEVFNLENFVTLDAVGSVDGDEDNPVAFEETPVGQDFVKKVEAYFCDICKRCLPRMEPLDKVIELHCRTRRHHAAYAEQCPIKKEKDDDSSDQTADIQDPNDEESTGMKRSESQERLWRETENDIGGLGEDNHSPFEESPLEIVELPEQIETGAGHSDADERDSEESNNALHQDDDRPTPVKNQEK